MTPASPQPPIASDDPAIEAEWRRLETARLAEEREEARENVTGASRHTPESESGRRWLLPAFGIALVAGIVLAIILNARGDEAVIDSLTVSGRPADVDALVDRLIASPTMLDVRSPALLVAASPSTLPATSVGVNPPAIPSAAEKPLPPARVRMLVEVIELPAQVSEPAAIPPEKSP
jgi:hypothetical protein